MNFKRILRGPIVWVLVAITFVMIASNLVGSVEYKRVDTSYGLSQIAAGKAESVTMVDGEQRVDVVLLA